MTRQGRGLRQGLPRVPGGAPWPPIETIAPLTGGVPPASSTPAESARDLSVEVPNISEVTPRATPAVVPVASALSLPPDTHTVDLRRGLPRTEGADPWPPARAVAAFWDLTEASPAIDSEMRETTDHSPNGAASTAPRVSDLTDHTSPPTEGRRYGRYTLRQWVGGSAILLVTSVALIALVVGGGRWLLSLHPVQQFLVDYPGEYHLPEGAPIGIPAWLAWQHFFNFFLMVLIIRSGWQFRTQKKPPAVWTSRRKSSSTVSLTVWFHQSLDLLWLVNGGLFIVLLFVSGQWMRVVPTSWEVFPNALSAVLQYASLNWPTENGWVNYNSLQQLAYFTTIFVAAPLAAATGFRLSGFWPAKAARLTKAYPIKWARAVHFPVMLYFVVFIVVHVVLVLSTGALRNLNHMYAAQGSTDPLAYAENWTGFWMFVVSLVLVIAALVAARPVALAPIARLFGTVSAR